MTSTRDLRLLSLYILCVGCMTSAGVANGWVALQNLLIREGQFVQGDSQLAIIPTIAFNVGAAATVLCGILLDRCNLKWLSVSGMTLFTLGVVLLAVSDSKSCNGFAAGLTLIASGGMCSCLTLYQFAYVFGKPILVRSVVNALYTASGLMFLLLIETSNNRLQMFLPYAVMCLALTGMALIFYPTKPFVVGDKYMMSFRSSGELTPHISVVAVEAHNRSRYQEVMDVETILLGLYFGIGLLVNNWFTTSIQDQLYQKGDSDGIYSTAFVVESSLLPIPISLSMDWHLRKFKYSGTITISLVTLVMSFLPVLLSDSLPVQVIGISLISYSRCLLTNVVYTYAADRFLPSHYGSIIAMVTFIAIPLGSIQVLVDELKGSWSGADYVVANVCCCVVASITIIYPLWVRIHKAI